MDSRRTLACASLLSGVNGAPPSSYTNTDRIGEVKRVSKETNISVKLNLNGSGVSDSNTGIPFLDHMLDQLASHGLFDVSVKATGDIHIDDHHTNEDVALAIGTAFQQALGDRKGINRFGDFSASLDEALVHVSLLVEHFFQSLVNTSGMTLHIWQLERMKNENSLLLQDDHHFDPNYQGLQREMMQLHKANEELGSMFPLFNEFSGIGNALERILALEIKLAEALQAEVSHHLQLYFNPG